MIRVGGGCLAAVILAISGCGPNPDTGPGSYQAVVEREQTAEQLLESQGAKLERKQYPPGDAWAIDLSGQQVSDATLSALRDVDRVAELNLSGTNVDDALLQQIASPEVSALLVDLNLSGTAVSDSGLKHVTESRFLSTLNLEGTNVTDAGVEEWKKARAADKRIRPGFREVTVVR